MYIFFANQSETGGGSEAIFVFFYFYGGEKNLGISSLSAILHNIQTACQNSWSKRSATSVLWRKNTSTVSNI